MICTYFTALFLLVLQLSGLAIWCEVPHCVEDRTVTLDALFWVVLTWIWDVVSLTFTPFPFFFILIPSNGDLLPTRGAMKRNFDPDIFMQILMFKDKKMPEQSPSVFAAKWGFSIHDPSRYQKQYGVRKVYNLFNNFGQDYIQMLGGSSLKTNSHQMKTRPYVNIATNQKIYSHKSSAAKGEATYAMETDAFGFNPNLLNQKLMQLSSSNTKFKYNKYVNQDNSDMFKNNKPTKHHPSASKQTEKRPSSEIKTNLTRKIFGNNTTNTKLGSKQPSGTPSVKYRSRVRNSFHFDPTDLNSKMFNSIAYNPTYVNSLSRSSARHERSTTDFDPNAMMDKYMELRTNIDSFGSYHPNDMISTILLLFNRNKKKSDGENFDPNGNSMLSSTQHWGFSVYNPLHSLEQYNGKNIGRGSSGPNPNNVPSGFNPNALNDHLMATINQHTGKHLKPSYGNTGFNSNNLNNKLFEGLSFNPATVNMKTILPIVHETIPMVVLTSLQNRTSGHELPGLAYIQGHEQKAWSAGSENGYVKNTHSNSNKVPNENSGELQQENSQYTSTTNGHTPNVHLIQNQNSNNDKGSINNGEAILKTPTNISVGHGNLYSEQANSMVQSNAAYQAGSENAGPTHVTGYGSLAGHIQANGNGYQQSMYQQGPTQGMINDTAILNGSGGTITQPQTQAGGLGSTTTHQNMLLSGNGLSTNLVEGKSSNITQSSRNKLESTMPQHFGGGDLGSQGKSQTSLAMVNQTATQIASGNIGTSFLPQTGAGGLGYSSASQPVTGLRGSNSGEQVEVGGVKSNTAVHGVAGGLGSTSLLQTAAGSLGPSSGSENATSWLNSGATGGTEFIGVGQIGSGSNLNSVTQTSNGKLGPNTAHQSAAGSLGSNVEAHTNLGGLGEYIISQTEPGGLGSSSVGQSDSGSLGSNYVLKTSKEMESNKESQTQNGEIGASNTIQSDIVFS